jgi:hypothetical protein
MKNLINGLKKMIDGFRFGTTWNSATGQETVNYPTPKPQYSPAPPSTPNNQYAQVQPTPQQQYGGGGFRIAGIPDSISQNLGNELDRYGLATEAARVLTHPREQTYTPQEVIDYGHENWNGGENPQFITTNTDRPQNNGTIDRGVMRENSATFKLLQGSHKWNTTLKENGLTSFDDLHDTAKSIRYAKILGDYYEQDLGMPRWLAWFAAPLDLRTKESSLANK